MEIAEREERTMKMYTTKLKGTIVSKGIWLCSGCLKDFNYTVEGYQSVKNKKYYCFRCMNKAEREKKNEG
jgi:hypothetical protein